ncbi:MAG: methyltransferase domain-containing protein [Pseudomonadota bacterium]
MGKAASDWDKAYAGPAPFGDAPCPGLVQTLARPGVTPGTALMLADGDGRNGTWLAALGIAVTAVDYAPAATAQARARDARAGVVAERITADLERWSPNALAVDLVTILYLQVPEALRRRVLGLAREAVAPGGHLFVEVFADAGSEDAPLGPPPPVRWRREEMVEALREDGRFVIVEALEGTVLLEDGPRHAGMARILRLLARRER